MAIRHGNTTIKWSLGSDSSGFAESIFLNIWASDLHVADHRQCCRTAHSSGFADDGFAVARQPQAAVLATVARADWKPMTGPRACGAEFQPAGRVHLSNN